MAFQIPGSVISAAQQAKASASAAAAALTPSYADMLDTIKSGSIFKDTAEDLGALGNLGVDTSAIAAEIEKAKSTMAIDMAVANAAVAQKAKEAQAAGTTVSEADMEAAMAPLSVLKNLKSTLSSAMSGAAAAASSAASVLGAALPGGIGGSLPSPTDLINSAASAVSAFSASVPPQEIEDPLNPGQMISNPAYEAFTAIPGNLDKIGSVLGLSEEASSIGAGLGSALVGFAAAAAAGKTDILGTLKADAMLATLTKPMPSGLGAIASDNLNLSSIDPYAAIKAQEAPVTTTVEKTPDPVRPKGNATILSKYKSIPIPETENRRIWTYELKGLATDRDNKGEAFWKSVGSTLEGTTEDQREAAKNKWFDGLLGPEKAAIRAQSVAIKQAKPEASSWTEEEAKIRAASKANAEVVYATPAFIAFENQLEEYNKYIDWYDLAYNNWLGANDRFTLPADLLTVLGTYNL
jgi:hypothetical protein